MDGQMLFLNLSVALVMTVQVNFYFNSVFGKEKSKPTKRWFILLFLLMNYCYLSVYFTPLLSSMIALLVIFCLALGYEVEMRMRVIFSVLYAVLISLINLLCLYLLHPSVTLILDGWEVVQNREDLFYAKTSLLLSCMIMFALVQIIRFIAKRRSFPLDSRYYLMFLSVPIISIYQVNVLSVYSEKNMHYFISIIGSIVLNVLVVYILDTVIARFQLVHENTGLQQQMDYQDSSYEKTVHSFKKIKGIIHDTNKQLLYVAACIEQGQADEASRHIRVILNKVEHAYHRVNTGNLVVDALVTNALNIGQENGIRIDTELRLHDRKLGIERYDLCVVLGNLLDNAVEASKKVRVAQDRHIFIQIRSNPSALLICVRNYVDQEVSNLGTQKEGPGYHGFGLVNIERICEKYGGHMTIESANHTFDNMVMIPFSTQDSLA